MSSYNEQFKTRTKKIALDVLKLYAELKKTDEIRIIGKQLIRSATSVAANYRASIRARSDAEKYSKLCIVVEEADETLFWLEILQDAKYVSVERLSALMTEMLEIVKVMSVYRKNTKKSESIIHHLCPIIHHPLPMIHDLYT